MPPKARVEDTLARLRSVRPSVTLGSVERDASVVEISSPGPTGTVGNLTGSQGPPQTSKQEKHKAALKAILQNRQAFDDEETWMSAVEALVGTCGGPQQPTEVEDDHSQQHRDARQLRMQLSKSIGTEEAMCLQGDCAQFVLHPAIIPDVACREAFTEQLTTVKAFEKAAMDAVASLAKGEALSEAQLAIVGRKLVWHRLVRLGSCYTAHHLRTMVHDQRPLADLARCIEALADPDLDHLVMVGRSVQKYSTMVESQRPVPWVAETRRRERSPPSGQPVRTPRQAPREEVCFRCGLPGHLSSACSNQAIPAWIQSTIKRAQFSEKNQQMRFMRSRQPPRAR